MVAWNGGEWLKSTPERILFYVLLEQDILSSDTLFLRVWEHIPVAMYYLRPHNAKSMYYIFNKGSQLCAACQKDAQLWWVKK